ncbi:ABC transporter permease subunit [Alcaligenes nematophilus]|jgi:putative spermidine/putrescine transport system permease protein|uniref:ABC transporter permease n=1 Tax=Alcaligenes nematophilus TaxID=2994643 RepID=UPI0035B50F8C
MTLKTASPPHRPAPLLLAVTGLTVLFLLGPILVSVLAGLVNNYRIGLKSGLTLKWVEHVWANYGSTVWLSLQLALLCVLAVIVLGVPCAYALARSRSRLARSFEELLTLPVAVPGMASALALLLAYGSLQGFRQSFWFILVGHIVFTLPFMVRTTTAALQKRSLIDLEEAARSLGASFTQIFFGILLPAILPAIVAGSLMVFTLSLGEFNLTWMLHTPLTRTLPVGLADSYASMRIEVGSAYTLIFMLVILPVLWGLQTLARLLEKHYGK